MTKKRERFVKLRDKLAAISEILSLMAQRFRMSFHPSASLTVDEELVRFFGHCRFRVYMPAKPDKYGLKVWVLADSVNGFCLNFQVYTGRPLNGEPDRHQAQRVVLELSSYLQGGYNITTDNFFTSLELATALRNRANPMTLVGTMRKNKPDIPRELLNVRGREQYSSLFAFDNNYTLVSYVPKPRKNVIAILVSTSRCCTVRCQITIINQILFFIII